MDETATITPTFLFLSPFIKNMIAIHWMSDRGRNTNFLEGYFVKFPYILIYIYIYKEVKLQK